MSHKVSGSAAWEDRASLPQLPGLYSFFLGGKLLYIGKTKNIAVRVFKHGYNWSYGSIDEVRYVIIADEKSRHYTELYLISKNQPEYNRTGRTWLKTSPFRNTKTGVVIQ